MFYKVYKMQEKYFNRKTLNSWFDMKEGSNEIFLYYDDMHDKTPEWKVT